MPGLCKFAVAVLALTIAVEAATVVVEDSQQGDLHIQSRQKRVIGGEPIEAGEWPWLVRLKGKVPRRMFWGFIPYDYATYYCGASVLNARWLVTAAHCFKQASYPSRATTPKYWHAKVGEVLSHTHWYDGIFGSADIHLDWIIIHPHYSEAQTWKNDIALVRLRESIPNPSPATLPSDVSDLPDNWPADGTTCVIKGWGCTAGGGSLSDHARDTVLPKYPDGACNLIYGVSMTTRLCAGEIDGDNGICNGDSGGPLVCDADEGTGTGNTRWVQAGVASFTSSQAPGSYPGVFTRITAYSNWIRDTIN